MHRQTPGQALPPRLHYRPAPLQPPRRLDPERQLSFIEALGDLGSVRAVAHSVNITPEGAYLLRRHAEAGELRASWDVALKLGVQRLEDVAMDRALNGIDVPVHSYGKLIGTRKVYNDAQLMFILRNRAKQRFNAETLHNPDAATKGQLAKLRKQWKNEWERDAAQAALAAHQGDLEQTEAEYAALIDPKPDRCPRIWHYVDVQFSPVDRPDPADRPD